MAVLKTQHHAGGFFSLVRNHHSPSRWLGLFLLAALLSAGCRREEISVYRVPKDSENPQPMGGSQAAGSQEMPPGHSSVADGGVPQSRIKYQTPAAWQEQPPTGMSVALFSIAGDKGEMSIMSFPGEGASQLSLINIVRENAGLPPLNDEQLAKLVEPVAVGKEKGSLIDLTAGTSATTNSSPSRVLVAVLPHEGVTWFFKLSGATDIVAAQKPALVDFLKSISFIAGGSAPPASIPPMADASTAPATSGTMPALPGGEATGDKPAWTPPATWKEVPPTQMLLAKFAISGTDGSADVTVSSFPGEVGGLLQNINRWRNQVGLAPIETGGLDKTATSLDVPGGKATLVDVIGQSPKTGKEARLIGVIWPRNGQTWFYKMMGDSAVAAREKDGFLKFIQSVRYPSA